jgi:translation initiation factor 1 (eIF-1/SUI1)
MWAWLTLLSLCLLLSCVSTAVVSGNGPPRELVLISGRGRRSEGGESKLQPAILRLLNEEFCPAQEAKVSPRNPGRFVVKASRMRQWAERWMDTVTSTRQGLRAGAGGENGASSRPGLVYSNDVEKLKEDIRAEAAREQERQARKRISRKQVEAVQMFVESISLDRASLPKGLQKDWSSIEAVNLEALAVQGEVVTNVLHFCLNIGITPKQFVSTVKKHSVKHE